MAALVGRRPPLATGGRTPGSAPLIGRIVEGVVRDLGSELALPRDQVATALVALFDGFGIERLADPEAAPDELLAHAITAILRGSTDQPP
jgi:hypothetical protein